MERQQIADLIAKIQKVKLDENKSQLLHLTAQKELVRTSIQNLAITEKKSVADITSEINKLLP